MNDILKAYMRAAPLFHEHFKRLFDISLHTTLMIKDKYIKTLYQDEDLYKLIDDSVKYRIGLQTAEPNKNNFIYSMSNPYMLTESLDDILQKIMYSAYPVSLLNEFRNYLVSYINDDRIVDLALSKLEVDLK